MCADTNGRARLIATSQAHNDRHREIRMDRLRQYFIPIMEERIMNKTISTLIAAVAAFALSGGAYAQSNNTLATPTTVSPAANATSGYGTPGVTSSDSGMGGASPNKSTNNNGSTSDTNHPGSHNTLATPSTVSPAAQ
jgi:hypothetical protein